MLGLTPKQSCSSVEQSPYCKHSKRTRRALGIPVSKTFSGTSDLQGHRVAESNQKTRLTPNPHVSVGARTEWGAVAAYSELSARLQRGVEGLGSAREGSGKHSVTLTLYLVLARATQDLCVSQSSASHLRGGLICNIHHLPGIYMERDKNYHVYRMPISGTCFPATPTTHPSQAHRTKEMRPTGETRKLEEYSDQFTN